MVLPVVRRTQWLVSVLACGATAVLYDGSPFVPSPGVLWELVDRHGFGAPAHAAILTPPLTSPVHGFHTALPSSAPVRSGSRRSRTGSTGQARRPRAYQLLHTLIWADLLTFWHRGRRSALTR